ncbi:unnamed protein product [Mycena citricolor]|uniref:Rad60/SUMO-like domain-containing protein n=2 Tax=Mycena citricolor TaxID=2018698 RepID=A0AAD2HYC5_9AGAR|nr:unnamed protein product [Mycena citricolor]
MSETQSSDSDSGSDVVVTGGSTSKRKAKGKERARSKSRSLTPPPEMSREQRDLLRNIVRETLGARDRDRTPSPPLDPDLSTDTIVFDPEVQAIINAANAGAKPSESNPISHSNETIEIFVHWKPHPRDEQGRKRTDIFKLNRTDTFRELFEAVAEDQSLLLENLRLSHNNIRIFPSVTPATLRIWDEADLEACDKTTWEFLHANPHKAGHNGSAIEIASDSEEEEEDEELLQSDAGDDDDETLKLVLRSSKTVGNDITLTVRPTTTCGAIVQAFLKKAGLAGQYGKPAGSTTKRGRGRKSAVASDKNPQLSIDGDRIDHGVPISEMDLDSGDVVDVVGL